MINFLSGSATYSIDHFFHGPVESRFDIWKFHKIIIYHALDYPIIFIWTFSPPRELSLLKCEILGT